VSLTDGLLSYWKLDEGSGASRLDSSGNGNTLTDHNTVGSVAGKIANAGSFAAASTQYLDCSVNNMQSSNADFTYTAWAKLASKPTEATIVTNGFPGFCLRYAGGATDRFRYQFGLTSATADNFGSPSTGIWYFIVGWFDFTAQKLNIQINNGAIDQNDPVGIDAGGATVEMGRRTVNYWDGDIDEVGIWNRVLTADERTSLYNNGSGLTYPFTAPLPPNRGMFFMFS